MLRYGTEYVDVGQAYYDQRYQQRLLAGLERKARDLGYTLIKSEDLPQPQIAG